MIRQFRENHPIEFTYILALLVGVFIWLSSYVFAQGEPEDVWLRVCYGAASVLMFTLTLETHEIARRRKTFRDIEFWQSAFYKGYAYAYIMILIMWQGRERFLEVFILWSIAGMIFGVVMNFITTARMNELVIAKYDLHKPIATKLSSVLFDMFLIPIGVSILLIVLFAEGGQALLFEPKFVLLFVMLWGFLGMKYVRKKRSHLLISERFFGTILLAIGVLFL